MLKDYLLYKNINGNSLEELVKYASGFSLDTFVKKMNVKATQQFILSTQNSGKCLQKCKHCFMVEGESCISTGRKMSTYEVDKVFKQFKEQDHDTYMYYQEPVLREDYFEMLDKFPQKIAEINPAYFLDEEVRKKVQNSPIEEIKHSLHGSPSVHIELTGTTEEFHKRFIEGLWIIKEMGLKLGIETTLFRDNAKDIPYIADMIDKLQVDDWYIGRIMPVGNGVKWKYEDFLTGKDAVNALSLLAESISKMNYKPRIKLESGWGPNFYNKWYYDYLLGTIPGELIKSVYYCDAIGTPMKYISVETGHIYPCFYFLDSPSNAIGKWNAEIQSAQIYEDRSKQWEPEILAKRLTGICSRDECLFSSICLGGCRGEAYSFAKMRGIEGDNALFSGMDFCITNVIQKELLC